MLSAPEGCRETLWAAGRSTFYEEKAKAWAMIRSGRSDVDVFAELHTLGLPAALVGAIMEQLTAR